MNHDTHTRRSRKWQNMQNVRISTSRHSPSLEDEGAMSPSLHSWAISPKSLLGKAFSQTIGLVQGGLDVNHTDPLSVLDSQMRAEPMATDCQGLRTWREARWIHSCKNLGVRVSALANTLHLQQQREVFSSTRHQTCWCVIARR